MANSEHISKLSSGTKQWNEWRSDNPDIAPDFADALFTLGQRQLGPVDLDPINLETADLTNAFLYYGLLKAARLGDANLSGADLSYARLEQADLKNVAFEGAILHQTDFLDADLEGANLKDTDLSKTRNLTQAQIETAQGNEATQLPEGLQTPDHWKEATKIEAGVTTADKEASEEKQQKRFVSGKTTNFYKLLELDITATDDEIRSAYRKLAKEYHPDLNPEDPDIAQQFQLLTSVYEVLSHPQKRQQYDRLVSKQSDEDAIQAELFG